MIKDVRFLSGNAIKIIAAILMVIDHFGLIFYPSVMVFRCLGRLSMPLFAYMVAEGTRYTKNKIKYLALVLGLGLICQISYAIYEPSNLYFSILITFTFSMLIIYALKFMKKCCFENKKWWLIAISILLFLLSIAFTNVFCYYFTVDYGFWGCMLPVFASLFDFRGVDNEKTKKYDKLILRAITFSIGIIVFVFTFSNVSFSIYALFSIPLILLYNGSRGKLKMKHFFYVFYPLHLLLLEGLYMIIYTI